MTPTEDELIAMNGGTPRTRGGEKVLWFGMNPSKEEHTERATEEFDPSEKLLLTGDRVLLTDFNKIANGGVHPAYSWQQTGSCVNSGADNGLLTRTGIDACIGLDPVPFTYPFTLAAYGLSRKLAFGDDSEGEGSSGDAMAVALQQLGSTEWNTAGLEGVLPVPKLYDIAKTYTAEQEMKWSRASYCPQSVKDACKQHTISYVKITTVQQAEAEIRKARPFTIAGNWGSIMGQMPYKGTGANRVLFGSLTSNWEHQQSCHGVWNHPQFGRLWYIMNNWYFLNGGKCQPVHGAPANDEPAGGYWVDDSMIQHQLSYRWGELRSVKTLKGYDQGKIGHIGV